MEPTPAEQQAVQLIREEFNPSRIYRFDLNDLYIYPTPEAQDKARQGFGLFVVLEPFEGASVRQLAAHIRAITLAEIDVWTRVIVRSPATAHRAAGTKTHPGVAQAAGDLLYPAVTQGVEN